MRLIIVAVLVTLVGSGCNVNAGDSNAVVPEARTANATPPDTAPAVAHVPPSNLVAAAETPALAPSSVPSSTQHHAKDEVTPPAIDPARVVDAPRVSEAARAITIPAGTTLNLELASSVSSAASHVEDPVRATVARPVVIDGSTVIPAGSTVSGYVTEATRSARVKGRARLGVRFNALRVNGARYDIRTAPITREARATKKDDAKKIAIGAGAGAVVGAIAGGKKGAAIGTGVGAGGGTAAVLATRGEEVSLPRGAHVTTRLASALTVRVH
jgi:hypothetical protein